MATAPESVDIYCLKCRAKTGSRDVEQATPKNGRPALRCRPLFVRRRQIPHRLRRMNLGRLAGLRLHPSLVVRQGAQPLLRGMSSAASPAQGFQRPTGGRISGSHLQGTPSRLLSPSPKAGSRAWSCAPRDGRCARPWPTPVGFRQPRPASSPW